MFLKRQCDRTLGAAEPVRAVGGVVLSTGYNSAHVTLRPIILFLYNVPYSTLHCALPPSRASRRAQHYIWATFRLLIGIFSQNFAPTRAILDQPSRSSATRAPQNYQPSGCTSLVSLSGKRGVNEGKRMAPQGALWRCPKPSSSWGPVF